MKFKKQATDDDEDIENDASSRSSRNSRVSEKEIITKGACYHLVKDCRPCGKGICRPSRIDPAREEILYDEVDEELTLQGKLLTCRGARSYVDKSGTDPTVSGRRGSAQPFIKRHVIPKLDDTIAGGPGVRVRKFEKKICECCNCEICQCVTQNMKNLAAKEGKLENQTTAVDLKKSGEPNVAEEEPFEKKLSKRRSKMSGGSVASAEGSTLVKKKLKKEKIEEISESLTEVKPSKKKVKGHRQITEEALAGGVEEPPIVKKKINEVQSAHERLHQKSIDEESSKSSIEEPQIVRKIIKENRGNRRNKKEFLEASSEMELKGYEEIKNKQTYENEDEVRSLMMKRVVENQNKTDHVLIGPYEKEKIKKLKKKRNQDQNEDSSESLDGEQSTYTKKIKKKPKKYKKNINQLEEESKKNQDEEIDKNSDEELNFEEKKLSSELSMYIEEPTLVPKKIEEVFSSASRKGGAKSMLDLSSKSVYQNLKKSKSSLDVPSEEIIESHQAVRNIQEIFASKRDSKMSRSQEIIGSISNSAFMMSASCPCLPGFCDCDKHWIEKRLEKLKTNTENKTSEIEVKDDGRYVWRENECVCSDDEEKSAGSWQMIKADGEKSKVTVEEFVCTCTDRIEQTVMILKPEAMIFQDVVKRALTKVGGLQIISERTVRLSPEQVSEIYGKKLYGKIEFPRLVLQLSEYPILVLSVAGMNAVRVVKSLVGPDKIIPATWFLPESIRRRFNIGDDISYCVDVSEDVQQAVSENRYVFPERLIEPITTSPKNIKDYCGRYIDPTLTKGLVNIAKLRPEDPVTFLAEWLLTHNPFQPWFKSGNINLIPT